MKADRHLLHLNACASSFGLMNVLFGYASGQKQQLQAGHYDVPERLFASIGDAWKLCTSALSEVKELIPEFFSNPYFLKNVNGYNFGSLQDGSSVVRHPVLPMYF
jgi:hypothetical protein